MKYYIRVEDSHLNTKNKLQAEFRERLQEEFHGTLCGNEKAREAEENEIMAMKHSLEKQHHRCKPLRASQIRDGVPSYGFTIAYVGRVDFLPVKKEIDA